MLIGRLVLAWVTFNLNGGSRLPQLGRELVGREAGSAVRGTDFASVFPEYVLAAVLGACGDFRPAAFGRFASDGFSASFRRL